MSTFGSQVLSVFLVMWAIYSMMLKKWQALFLDCLINHLRLTSYCLRHLETERAIVFEFKINKINEGSRGAETQSLAVNATPFGFDPHSSKLNIYFNLYFYFFALVSRQSGVELRVGNHSALINLVCPPCCLWVRPKPLVLK